MSEHPAPPPPLSPDREVYCVTCRYDLRGQPLTGHCPECGTPVWRSPAGPRLRPGRWDERLAWLLALATIINVAFTIHVATSWRHTTNTTDPHNRWLGRFAAYRAAAALVLIGLSLLWHNRSDYPNASKFWWVLLAANVLTLICWPPL